VSGWGWSVPCRRQNLNIVFVCESDFLLVLAPIRARHLRFLQLFGGLNLGRDVLHIDGGVVRRVLAVIDVNRFGVVCVLRLVHLRVSLGEDLFSLHIRSGLGRTFGSRQFEGGTEGTQIRQYFFGEFLLNVGLVCREDLSLLLFASSGRHRDFLKDKLAD